MSNLDKYGNDKNVLAILFENQDKALREDVARWEDAKKERKAFHMEQPEMPEDAKEYEILRNAYGDACDRAGAFRYWRGNASDLNESASFDANIEKLHGEIDASIGALVFASTLLSKLEEMKGGLESLNAYSRACWKYSEWKSATEQFNPEVHNLKAVAEKLFIVEAYEAKGKKSPTHYIDRARILALVWGIEVKDVLEDAREYLKKNPLKYTVSTGRLVYLNQDANGLRSWDASEVNA
jgi:hypothetical protein